MAENKKRRGPQQMNNDQQPGKGRRWISLLFYTLAFAILGFYLFGDKEGNGVTKELSYTKLTAYIEVGAIDKIEVTDDLKAKATVKPQNYTLVF
ncbi:MAG: ATP-dependent metallopeptidase FtsH/Yme1/Tma family protein, partial [Paludibacteraceae bacterium]|nr:ATP-dependent metallopeptidase FtsH/Yme1/Tma family protein [Paludibacteraceae bacterium]